MLEMTIKGLDGLNRKLESIGAGIVDNVARALAAEAEIEMTEAKKRTPVDTGALRASGHVSAVRRIGRTLEVTLGFGGAAAPYAIFVHENMEAFHKVGQAKFLESTILESAPYLPERIAARVRGSFGG